jgi:phospholipid-transporting ATPase
VDSGDGIVNEFLTLLSVCHSVLPVVKAPKEAVDEMKFDMKRSPIEYQAASPDEQALVVAAKNLQYYYFRRIAKNIKLRDTIIDGQVVYVNIRGKIHDFEQFALLEFTSSRKRMSIVVRDPRDGKIKLYCKGADNIIFERLTDESKANDWSATEQHLKDYAVEGLRTLCCAYREFTEEEFQEWYEGHQKAETSMGNRAYELEESAARLEKNLVLLGCTAIEDRLQDGVPETIHSLANADIKIWVLTGDKVETAINIGKSCKLLTPKMAGDHNMLVIDIDEQLPDEEAEKETLQSLDLAWDLVKNKADGADDQALVISGKALGFIFPIRKLDANGNDIIPSKDILDKEQQRQTYFLQICRKCKAVICCRVSPKQKSEVVLLVKNNLKGKVTLAIGDGANDVPMIKAAHVGIGISGNEGLQAVMASDYAIAQFRFLKPLVLIHGQWSYRRITALINYSFYKNITITLCNIWFSFFNGFSGTLFFDPVSTSAYNLVFTALPILFAAMFNRDLSKKTMLNNPEVYKSGQRSEKLNLQLLGIYMLKAAYHSLVLYFFAALLFSRGPVSEDGQMFDVWVFSTSVYASLIVLVTIEVGIASVPWFTWTVGGIVFSLGLWFLFIFVYSISNLEPNMYYVANTLYSEPAVWLYILLSVTICLIPEVAFNMYQKFFNPTRETIMKECELLGKDFIKEARVGLLDADKLPPMSGSARALSLKNACESILVPDVIVPQTRNLVMLTFLKTRKHQLLSWVKKSFWQSPCREVHSVILNKSLQKRRQTMMSNLLRIHRSTMPIQMLKYHNVA